MGVVVVMRRTPARGRDGYRGRVSEGLTLPSLCVRASVGHDGLASAQAEIKTDAAAPTPPHPSLLSLHADACAVSVFNT